MQSLQARHNRELQAAAILEKRKRKSSRTTVFGIVSPTTGHLRSIVKRKGQWVETIEEPDIYLAEKMELALKSTKRYIVLIGGRGSTKSVGATDICIADAKDNKSKTYFLREFQSSIKNSIISLVKEEIGRFGFDGFDIKQNSIGVHGEQAFEFAGLARNIDSVKSTHGFKRFLIEESQFISAASLTALTATIRNKPKNGLPAKFVTDVIEDIETHPDLDNVSMIFIANTESEQDPFSQRFIVPYKQQLDQHGIYEDDLHLILMVNYEDNPWFEDSGLDAERVWDYENRSRAYYDYRWHAEYNDSVENGLILSEWFDACIDAHKTLGFEPLGARLAAYDPSDGGDAHGYAARHGSVYFAVEKKEGEKVNTGCDWATGLATNHMVHKFTWDCDGLGAALSRQVEQAFTGTRTEISMFRGSETVDYPDNTYNPATKHVINDQKKNKNAFKNQRAQYYTELRDRVYLTYLAVTQRKWADPDKLISFSSEATSIRVLRSELCRMPVKPNRNGLFELYTKAEMMAKFKIKSPNLADAVMMCGRNIVSIDETFEPEEEGVY